MNYLLLSLTCLISFELHSLEFETIHENDRVSVTKVKMTPYEEVGFHRDAYPRVVVGLKGGTITRIEANGSTREINFPSESAVFLEADPEGEMYKAINKASDPIEVIVIQLKDKT